MEKVNLNPSNVPLLMPAAVISVGTMKKSNLITLAYVGKLCMSPPTIGIGVHPTRFSYAMLQETGEFGINLPAADQTYEVDYCGTRSGKNIDKWEELNLTPFLGKAIQTPLINEFPWNIECKITKQVELGSHTCFFGEVLAVHALIDSVNDNKIDPTYRAQMGYISGNYLPVDKKIIGTQGFSLKK